ncbi:MAG: murein biosynthesis integral membrane protein MurJ [Candidatus Omnitrophota bacterium]
MTKGKLLRSTGIIGIATTTSRVLGFVRDILFARLFGTNIFAQAFVVAFRLPNMLRDMVGEGATDAAIVPVLTEYKHTRTLEEYWEAARVIFYMMLAVLMILSLFGVVFAPVLVRVMAPGFIRDPEKFATAVFLTRTVFPYVFFLGMVAYSKGVLNSFHYFITPAFAPVVLNISLILTLLFLCPAIGIKGMVLGVLIGGFLEALLQVRPLVKRGFRLGRKVVIAHPIAKRIANLLLPRALGSAVYQMSVLVDTVLASFAGIVGSGGVAALYYSNRLVQLPLAVFGISLATAALPRMSREVSTNDMGQLRDTISFSLRTVFTIMAPAAVGLMILARPMIRVLFQRGEFTEYSTGITSNALFFYSFGLIAYAGIKILVNAYYAMGDTRTPVRTASISLGINLVLNLILMWPLKLGGLALATSIAATCNFIMLYRILVKRVGDIGTKDMIAVFLKVLAAAGIMGICAAGCAWLFLRTPGPSGIMDLFKLAATILLSGLVYFCAAHMAGVAGARGLWRIAAGRFMVKR